MLESRELGDVAEEQHGRDAKRRLLVKVVLVPIGMGLFVATGWLLSRVPSFIDWLIHRD